MIIYKTGEIDLVRQAFFTQKEEDIAIFVLLGRKHYEITYNSKEEGII